MRFIILVLVLMPVTAFAMKPSFGPDPSMILGGEEGDSCQIIMCLSDPLGQDISECQEPLERWERTRPEKRPELLEKCPMVTGGLSE